MADQHTTRKTRKPQQARPEFEVAYFTQELGRPLQRQMLARQLASLGDSEPKASHGEDAPVQADSVPPREDRAG